MTMPTNENYGKPCLVFGLNKISALEIFSPSFICYKDANFLCSPVNILQILNPAEIFVIPCSH
jgi:hypothetical protein